MTSVTLFKVWIPNSESFHLGETGKPQVKSIEIGFYSVMKDQDYEPVLNQFIEKYSSEIQNIYSDTQFNTC